MSRNGSCNGLMNKNSNYYFYLSMASLIIILLSITCGYLIYTPNISGTSTSTRADYYNFAFNSTVVAKETDGKEPVDYVILITNTGNVEDTITLFANIINVTDCDEPDIYNWSYVLDKPVVTLQPAESTPIILTISASCKCQVGCVAAIAVKGISGGDPAVTNSILTYTTRGESQQLYGLKVEIDFDPFINTLYLDNLNELNVYIWNIQNIEDSISIWLTSVPANWTVSVTPSTFSMTPNSKQTIKLNLIIPSNTPIDDYLIELRAQSQNPPNIHTSDSIKIPVKPDIIIKDATFSTSTLKAGEKVKIMLKLENIGLATGSNIPIVVYDQLDFNPSHEIARTTIPAILPSQIYYHNISWEPKRGDYNITIRIDPESSLDELRVDNNLRLEPVTVAEGDNKDGDDTSYIAFMVYLVSIIAVILVLIIVYFIYSRRSGVKDDIEPVEETSRFERDARPRPTVPPTPPLHTTKIKQRTLIQKPPSHPPQHRGRFQARQKSIKYNPKTKR